MMLRYRIIRYRQPLRTLELIIRIEDASQTSAAATQLRFAQNDITAPFVAEPTLSRRELAIHPRRDYENGYYG